MLVSVQCLTNTSDVFFLFLVLSHYDLFSQKKRREVDVLTGVTNADFKDFQLKNKLHLPANTILDVVQMVSVVATGCHVSIYFRYSRSG